MREEMRKMQISQLAAKKETMQSNSFQIEEPNNVETRSDLDGSEINYREV